MTSGRFRAHRKPPPWAELRAGRIRGPSRMAFWCDIFLSRDLRSRRKSGSRRSMTSRHPNTDGAFDFVAVGSRYRLRSGNTSPNSNNLRS
jgi:hypothetical protein